MELRSLPEELLARILSLCLLPPPRPSLDVFPPRNRAAPLLVSRQFLRIASPLFYHTLHFRSPHQASHALETLTRHPALTTAVRQVVFGGVWRDCAGVLALCASSVLDVDIRLDGGPDRHSFGPGDLSDVDVEAFCNAIEKCHTIAHLTLRKDPAVYLTHPRPAYILERLAQAVRQWTTLETVHFAFRISSSPSTLPLARALGVAPHLRCVRAQVPAVWNSFLLLVSTNPRLEKVVLYAEPTGPAHSRPAPIIGSTVIKGGYTCDDDAEHAVFGTGLYMIEAKKHERLSELIKSGTSIVRTRAHTTIATLSTLSAGGTPLGTIKAKELSEELVYGRESSGGVALCCDPLHVHARHSVPC